MSRERLRVGFLSAVRHMQPYAAALAADGRVELVGAAEEPAAADWIRADSRAAAQVVGIPYVEDVDAFLASADAVVVCSEPTRHARLAERVVEAGLHVLVDKPVGVAAAEADKLAAVAAGSRGTVSVVNRRMSPAVRRLQRWIDAGHLGLPLHVDAEWFASGAHLATSVERPELVVDPALSGGGELLNFLLYPVDYIRQLTGLEIVEVYCEAATLFGAEHRKSGVEDCAVVSLLLERGVTATVTLGRIPAAPGIGPVTSTVRVLGSHGHAVADDDRPQVRRYTTEGGLRVHPIGGPSSDAIIELCLRSWVDDVLAGRAPAYGLAEARSTLAVVDAAYESCHTGQPARVEKP
ncbi:Gfo/Idh/MocA family protein [Kribbella sp. NPDC059898]|uniref:Gfo/Idh/MocA family protein n=1 Tax=Kribbella sp. NPDC059898 TaxID=3346995 RepID=UPI0036625F76